MNHAARSSCWPARRRLFWALAVLAANFTVLTPAKSASTNIPGIGPAGPIMQRHSGFIWAEGPAADANGNVFFSDIQSNRIYKSDTSGVLSIFLTNTHACNGLMFDQSGRLIACQRDLQRVIAIDVATAHITPLATNWNGRAFHGPNDLVVDLQGGVYFTDPSYAGKPAPTQSVYYVAANGGVSQIASNLSRPNGVILSPDETKLYVVLSGESNLVTYPLPGPGLLGPPSVMPIPRPGDGMTIDTLGNLYLCQPSASNITVFNPGGAMLGMIRFPESPANCAFGSKDMKTLFAAARTSIYTCRMETTGHVFASNPSTYPDFQRKFFNSTNAPKSAPTDDPDGDGASNQLEFLTRTHPLLPGDAWKISIARAGNTAHIQFPQIAGRGFEVQQSSRLARTNIWETLAVPGNPVAVSSSNRSAAIDAPFDPGQARFYRVHVFEP